MSNNDIGYILGSFIPLVIAGIILALGLKTKSKFMINLGGLGLALFGFYLISHGIHPH